MSAVIAQIIHEEMTRHWTPTLEDAERAAERVIATLRDRDALCPDSAAHGQPGQHPALMVTDRARVIYLDDVDWGAR